MKNKKDKEIIQDKCGVEIISLEDIRINFGAGEYFLPKGQTDTVEPEKFVVLKNLKLAEEVKNNAI